MHHQLILKVTLDDRTEIDCTPLYATASGLGLGNDGITWQEASLATLHVNDYDELFLTPVEGATFTLTRHDRTRVIRKPTRILVHDEIQWTATTTHTLKIKQIYRSNVVSNWLSRLNKQAMFASAATMLLSILPSCDTVPSSRVVGKMLLEPDVNTNNLEGKPTEPTLPPPELNDTIADSATPPNPTAQPDTRQAMPSPSVSDDMPLPPPELDETGNPQGFVTPEPDQGQVHPNRLMGAPKRPEPIVQPSVEDSPKPVLPARTEGKMLILPSDNDNDEQ